LQVLQIARIWSHLWSFRSRTLLPEPQTASESAIKTQTAPPRTSEVYAGSGVEPHMGAG
jgi:hypothetical protein